MKNFWTDKREEFRTKIEAETAFKCGRLAAEMEDKMRLQIRDELRASMEKEYLIKMREMAELYHAQLHAEFSDAFETVQAAHLKIEALEEENRVLRMANLVGVKIADKLPKK